MSSITKIQEITLRLDHIEATSEWLARALISQDPGFSQSATTVLTLAEDVREKLLELVRELEGERSAASLQHPVH